MVEARNFEANVAVAEEPAGFAEGKGITLAQLAPAWLLAKKDYVVPIPGSRHPDRVAQNVAAADITPTAEDLAVIAAIAPDGALGGRLGWRRARVPRRPNARLPALPLPGRTRRSVVRRAPRSGDPPDSNRPDRAAARVRAEHPGQVHQKRNGLQDCEGFGAGLRLGRGAPVPDVGAEVPAPVDADGSGADAEADADALAEALGRALRDGRTDVLGATETGTALAGAAVALPAEPATWSSTDAVTG
ncbi:aldo/keto reductase [Kitasatospora paranensis]|uniref:Aldo/keto reductase n=1 Tax=Kitasatospora paranensis TaxID=258053 RepID=A0ABW2FXC6_9ACTN